ncbi:MAG: hypothetical protein Kow0074_05320 [Candidatus Zixiibacteriota bacterium]
MLGCLYAYFSTGGSVDEVFSGQARRASCDAVTEEWSKQLFDNAIQHAEEIDRTIRNHAQKWDFGRIGQIEKNILRLSIAELRYCLDTPPKVAINEALELAKDYVGDHSLAFINGILDRVYKLELEKSKSGHSTETTGGQTDSQHPGDHH